MTEQHGLQAGIVEFSEPVFLLIGGEEGFGWLAERIQSRCPIVVQGDTSKAVGSLSFVPSPESDGEASIEGAILEWRISATEAIEVARLLRALAASSRPAHAYLDPGRDRTGLQIIASKGEYDPMRIFQE